MIQIGPSPAQIRRALVSLWDRVPIEVADCIGPWAVIFGAIVFGLVTYAVVTT